MSKMSKGGQGSKTYDVYVCNLPSDANDALVRKQFSAFGEVQSLTLMDDRNGPGKVGFVRYHSENDAVDACKADGNLDMKGKKIGIRRAKKTSAGPPPGKRTPTNRSPRDSTSSFSGPDIVPLSDISDRRLQHSDSDTSLSSDSAKEEVVVTHVESAICVWVQTINSTNVEALNSLTGKLEQICPVSSPVKGTPISGKLYGTKFSQDGLWYRSSVQQLDSIKAKVKVLFVDYGNMEEKEINELVEIPQSLANITPFAKKIVLHGLAVKTNGGGEPVTYESFVSGVEYLRELTEGQFFMARQSIPLRDQMGFYGDLFVGDKSVSEMVVREGFAIRRSFVMQKSQKPSSAVTSTSNGSISTGSSPMKNVNNNNSLSPGSNKASRSELSECRLTLEKERAEKDRLTYELASLKGKLKSSQAEVAAISNKIVQNTVSHQIREIVSLADKARSLRSQFPSDTTVDSLCQSLTIATDEGRVSLDSISSLRQVNETLNAYTAAQNAIRECETQTDLDAMIINRDKSRVDHHTSLKLFLEESNRMPLEERMTKVKGVLETLRESFSGFLQIVIKEEVNLASAQTIYQEWKDKILGIFQGIRAESNDVQVSINSTLSQLQQLMSLEGQVSSCLPDSDLDYLFKKYIVCLQKEVSVTDVQNSVDAPIMASIVQEVKRAIEEELKIIESVKCLREEFTWQEKALEEWLTKKPDLKDVKDIKKKLRGFKSKLRHLLADKEDIDENDEGSEGERERIDTDLKDIRLKIQETLLQEEELLMKYSYLQEEHFPELKFTHGDLNLHSYQLYQGLLKTSRETDHYDLVPFPGELGCYVVTFLNEPAMLKEYMIDDQIHSTQGEFMRRAVKYRHVDSPWLQPIHAAFLSKNQRQVYLQTSVTGTSLVEFIRKEESKPWVIQKILRCITEAVVALHGAEIVHGSISPNCVFVTEAKTATLMFPDFSRPNVDPSRTWYTSQSGVQFKAPEEDRSNPPTIQSDLFSLGLLYLWIHLPNSAMEMSSKGVPEMNKLALGNDIIYSAQALLCPEPDNRVKASEILQTGYFQNTIPDLLHVESVDPSPQNGILETSNEDINEAVTSSTTDTSFTQDFSFPDTTPTVQENLNECLPQDIPNPQVNLLLMDTPLSEDTPLSQEILVPQESLLPQDMPLPPDGSLSQETCTSVSGESFVSQDDTVSQDAPFSQNITLTTELPAVLDPGVALGTVLVESTPHNSEDMATLQNSTVPEIPICSETVPSTVADSLSVGLFDCSVPYIPADNSPFLANTSSLGCFVHDSSTEQESLLDVEKTSSLNTSQGTISTSNEQVSECVSEGLPVEMDLSNSSAQMSNAGDTGADMKPTQNNATLMENLLSLRLQSKNLGF